MTNEEKMIKYNNRKYMAVSLGTGAMIGNAAFGILDRVANNFDCGTFVFVTGTVAAVVTGVALIKKNPYKKIVKEEQKVKKLERK